jgi:hypothetical protein
VGHHHAVDLPFPRHEGDEGEDEEEEEQGDGRRNAYCHVGDDDGLMLWWWKLDSSAARSCSESDAMRDRIETAMFFCCFCTTREATGRSAGPIMPAACIWR